jgi:hypothetical protein
LDGLEGFKIKYTAEHKRLIGGKGNNAGGSYENTNQNNDLDDDLPF